MRLSILVIFLLAVLFNVPDWMAVQIYKNDEGRFRGRDTIFYNSMPGYYTFYSVSIDV